MRRHIRAIEDRLRLERPHQFMQVRHDHLLQVVADFRKPILRKEHLPGHLWWLQVVVHQTTGFVFDLVRQNTVFAFRR